MLVGKIIGGEVGKVLIRFKHGAQVDVGDILIASEGKDRFFLKLVNMNISSLVPTQFIEDMAGQKLEYDLDYNVFDEKDRFYRVGVAKVIRIFRDGKFIAPRSIPSFFADVHKVTPEEFRFLASEGEIPIGYLRLGTEVVKDIVIKLPAEKLISHHMLVVAATGKGKSNFAKVFARGLLLTRQYATIIFDPHNEYYGGKGVKGLRDHPLREQVVYFTPHFEGIPEAEPLRISVWDLEPSDFYGIIDLSIAQQEAMDLLFRFYGKKWIYHLFTTSVDEIVRQLERKVYKATLATLKRKLNYALELSDSNGLVFSLEKTDSNIFEKIIRAVNDRKLIIVDTSMVGEEAEKVVASSIVRRVFEVYRRAKQSDPKAFELMPEVLVVFEEAPRVIGIEALKKGSNIFERIAREGRKFKVGLCAITQMPSLLPKEILSQMNTKVILGIPSPADREAVVNSSAQNISDETAEIQMLDKGEAIITSPFVQFPLPVKIFLFEDVLADDIRNETKVDVEDIAV